MKQGCLAVLVMEIHRIIKHLPSGKKKETLTQRMVHSMAWYSKSTSICRTRKSEFSTSELNLLVYIYNFPVVVL